MTRTERLRAAIADLNRAHGHIHAACAALMPTGVNGEQGEWVFPPATPETSLLFGLGSMAYGVLNHCYRELDEEAKRDDAE